MQIRWITENQIKQLSFLFVWFPLHNAILKMNHWTIDLFLRAFWPLIPIIQPILYIVHAYLICTRWAQADIKTEAFITFWYFSKYLTRII